ncbi:MAG: hypothetical protein PHV68_09780 [Candidatus Gastranaerophilales bacterium]|jgi:orotidine-5'-phosphate decarboxylase|nr:hypothetical protein [Candidatus Gastranaerophilales bacterium]
MLKIGAPRGIIPACDVSLEKMTTIAEAIFGIKEITALKIGGITPTIEHGLAHIVEVIKDYNPKIPLIFDFQKAGNDIPEMGEPFAEAVYSAGADAVILFPFAGAKTERMWIEACQNAGLIVYVGGHMTQFGFLEEEGGVIVNPSRIYQIAAKMGVQRFVVPGNHPELVLKYQRLLASEVPDGKFRLVAPGFINQGGDISETGKEAGEYFDAIVGRAITQHDNILEMRKAIKQLVTQIRRKL